MPLQVMVVDDEPSILRLLKELLAPAGFEATLFSDSREAAETVRKQKFDAVFVDAKMPHLDGFELVRRVRTSPSNSLAPVVMLTGYDDPDTMRKGFGAGATYFLGKPITPKKLRALLVGLTGMALRERRRYARLPLRTSVSCKAGAKTFQATSLNISQGGMLMEQSGGLKPSDLVKLGFSFPEIPGKVAPEAHVIRVSDSDKMAVSFNKLEPEDKATIQDYVVKNVKI